jgi:hypothetical protein
MFVRIPSNHERQVTGVLETIPDEFLKKAPPPLPDGLLPTQIDVTDYRESGYVGLAFGLPLGILAIWNIWKAFSRFGDAGTHPLYRSLGLMGDAAALAEEIDMQTTLPQMRIGPVVLTQSWLLRRRWFRVELIHVASCLWIFKKITRHYVNWIPTGRRTYAAIIRDRFGQSCEVDMKEHKADELLQEVGARAPWSLAGFDKGIEELWRKDRQKLASIVESRWRALTPDSAPGEC